MNDEIINFETRVYSNPQLPVDESNAFIENLRQTQAADTERINQQTYALGTQVPANLGGLSGSETTFAERYQKPQTEQMIADLKATAQTQALNQALENTLAQYKNRYNQAYRNARERAYNESKKGSSGSGNVETIATEPDATATGYVSGAPGKYTVVDPSGNLHVVDMGTGDEEVVYNVGSAEANRTYDWAPADVLATASGIGALVGKPTYTLPSGNKVKLGGFNEKLRLGSDGRYYIWNQDDNTYRLAE